MNTVKSVIAGLAIIASGAAVSDSWYLGEAVSHYVLDDQRALEGDIEGTQAGLHLGKYLRPDRTQILVVGAYHSGR